MATSAADIGQPLDQRGIIWVTRSLAHGLSLSEAVFRANRLVDMQTRALLPDPARADQMDPQWGSPDIPGGSTDMLLALLKACSADGDRLLVIEESKAKPDYEWFIENRSRLSVVIEGDEIYHWLRVSSGLSLDSLMETIQW